MQKVSDFLYTKMEKHKNNFLSQPIGIYLINACGENDSQELCEAVLNENKSFEHCLNYILNYAKKNAVKIGSMSCSGFSDDVVYAKAVEYYLSDNISEDDIKGFGNDTRITGSKNEDVKVAESKISSDEQASVFDLMEGDAEDENSKEQEEKTETE